MDKKMTTTAGTGLASSGVVDDGYSDAVADSIAEELDSHCAAEPEELAGTPTALLDLTGVTPHSRFAAVERERWEAGQNMAFKLAAMGLSDTAYKLRQCHSFQTFAVCDGCSKKTAFWNRCDIFYCPQCSPRLSKRRLDGLMFFVEKMARPKHLVLTFRNVASLTTEYLRGCVAALTKFRRRKIFRGVVSGLWAMEITNEGRGFHVHFHLVVDGPWMDVRQVSATWKACTNCDSTIVWIEDASRGGLRANLPRYVTKYCGKGFRPHDWSAEQLHNFVTSVEGCRTFGVFGQLLGARKEWSDWLKAVRVSRRQCECGCCSKRYMSEAELWWSENFTGFDRAVRPRPPTSLTLGPCQLTFAQ